MTPRAAYIHVPFCRHRCGYCDFTLVAGRDELIERYLRALQRELASLSAPVEVDTLYLGGGTPTHLAPRRLEQLFGMLRQRFVFAAGYEFSIEANPADVTDEHVACIAEAGVNRVSLGVQSFDDAVLRTLERDHDAGIVARAVERLRQRIDNISFDLIFGVPCQTLCVWKRTLQQAVNLRPMHLSTYGLTYEKGTAFWTRRRKGELIPVPEQAERRMYAASMDDLTAAGFEQYEISSFAQPGFRCRHNEVYWTGAPYLAFGPGAARFLDGVRETNHRSVTTWMTRVLNGESPVGESEHLGPVEAARERLILGLRRTEGVAIEEFHSQTGCRVQQLAPAAINRHLAAGLLERTETHLRLSRQGRFLADEVAVDLL